MEMEHRVRARAEGKEQGAKSTAPCAMLSACIYYAALILPTFVDKRDIFREAVLL